MIRGIFGNVQMSIKFGTLDPVLMAEMLTKTQELIKHHLDNYYFTNLKLWNSTILKMLERARDESS